MSKIGFTAGDFGRLETPEPTPETFFSGTPFAVGSVNFGEGRTSHSGSVYLAGPITGLTYSEARYGWRQTVADRLAPGIEVLSPMRHEGHLSETLGQITGTTGDEHIMSKPKVIFTKDKLDIARADIVLINLLEAGDRCARGSLIELGMAHAMGRYVVLVVEKGSFHDYPFATEAADVVVHDLDTAIEVINSLLSEGV